MTQMSRSIWTFRQACGWIWCSDPTFFRMSEGGPIGAVQDFRCSEVNFYEVELLFYK